MMAGKSKPPKQASLIMTENHIIQRLRYCAETNGRSRPRQRDWDFISDPKNGCSEKAMVQCKNFLDSAGYKVENNILVPLHDEVIENTIKEYNLKPPGFGLTSQPKQKINTPLVSADTKHEHDTSDMDQTTPSSNMLANPEPNTAMQQGSQSNVSQKRQMTESQVVAKKRVKSNKGPSLATRFVINIASDESDDDEADLADMDKRNFHPIGVLANDDKPKRAVFANMDPSQYIYLHVLDRNSGMQRIRETRSLPFPKRHSVSVEGWDTMMDGLVDYDNKITNHADTSIGDQVARYLWDSQVRQGDDKLSKMAFNYDDMERGRDIQRTVESLKLELEIATTDEYIDPKSVTSLDQSLKSVDQVFSAIKDFFDMAAEEKAKLNDKLSQKDAPMVRSNLASQICLTMARFARHLPLLLDEVIQRRVRPNEKWGRLQLTYSDWIMPTSEGEGNNVNYFFDVGTEVEVQGSVGKFHPDTYLPKPMSTEEFTEALEELAKGCADEGVDFLKLDEDDREEAILQHCAQANALLDRPFNWRAKYKKAFNELPEETISNFTALVENAEEAE